MIHSVSLSHFRGVTEDAFAVGSHTAIIGENGSGKTHILEALHLLSGGSFHGFQKREREDFGLEMSYEELIGEKKYRIQREGGKLIHMIQGTKVSGKKYHESLPYRSVFIGPFDMNLLYFAPSLRREYIDDVLERAFMQFHNVKRDYETVMRQRNALLKKIRDNEASRSDLDYWDKVFTEKAELYTLYRKKWYDFVKAELSTIGEFLPKYTLEFIYESRSFHENDIFYFIQNYLFENRERDIITGHTHIGPHLEDFSFQVQTGETYEDASMYLSRGETKMLLLGLKQIEVLFLRKSLSLPIILLFDDMFAELDMKHAEKIIERFDIYQIVFTSQRSLPKGEKWLDFSCINLSHE